MKIHLKCFAMLADAHECDYSQSIEHEIPDGETVGSLIMRLGIPPQSVKMIFVNGRLVETDALLNDGDQVGLAPAVVGM
jgi:molybdopterin converting factor small subunit